MLDWEAFLKLRARQMVEAKARGERVMLDEVQAAIARFNLVANWVGSEVGPLVFTAPADSADRHDAGAGRAGGLGQ